MPTAGTWTLTKMPPTNDDHRCSAGKIEGTRGSGRAPGGAEVGVEGGAEEGEARGGGGGIV
jgi:hypothetical protein